MIIYFFIKASEKGQLATVKYLIEKGADINKQNKKGDADLHWGN